MGLTDVGTYGVVNEIRADYRNGRPRSVVDAAEAPILEGSLTGSGLQVKVTHEYDANGNLVKDATRGIDSIRYNVLNLPERIYFSNGYRLDYVYRADGVKLRETRRRPTFSIGAGSAGVITETTDYVGSYELEGGIPRRLNLPGGYMTIADTVYHHYIPDYQGNILAVVNTRTRQLEQRTDYYPYGMPHGSATGAGVNKRKYSGKELITFADYDAMDYHARWRPTALPLFTTPDPLAEDFLPYSLYSYCGGDPINNIDPTGMSTWCTVNEDGNYVVIGGNLEDDDLNIYYGTMSDSGVYTVEGTLGVTTSITSFYNSDIEKWAVGSIINVNDKSGYHFLNEIFSDTPSLGAYAAGALRNEIYDFKTSSGIKNYAGSQDMYRGMLIGKNISGNSVISSARDIGNIAAGFVAGANGIPWACTRLAFDTYQSTYEWQIETEGLSSINAQKYGWSLAADQLHATNKLYNLTKSYINRNADILKFLYNCIK